MIRKTIHMNSTGEKGVYMAQHHKKLVSTSFIHILCVVICTIATCLILNTSNAQTGNLNRYNVILISMDDMADKTNYLGYPVVLTPNLQRLINKSTAFTNAYCQYPLCNPSRSSIMTGWRPDKTTVFGNSQDPILSIPAGANYLQEYFHSFGYRTERYGKIYHGPFEAEFNWDYAEGRDNSSFKANDGESVIANAGAGPDGGSWGIDQLNDTDNVDYLLVTNLIASLKKPSSQPRFFALGLSNHNPFTPTIDFWNLYGDATVKVNLPIFGSKTNATIQGNSAAIIEVPNTPADDRADIPPIALLGNNTIVKSDSDWRKTVQAYYGEVSRMDKHLGMLLDELDRGNLWENTVIVFVSDHGQHLGEHGGLWLKNTLFNESLHVPMLIYAPGKAANLCNKLVEEVDIYPTLTELCKLPTPKSLEGVSLVRLMNNPFQNWKKAAFSQIKSFSAFVPKAGAVITEQFHYNNWGAGGEELYEKASDPKEYVNLITNPTYASSLQYMRDLYTLGWLNALPPPCDSVMYYKDNDGDGFGNIDSAFKGCYQPLQYVSNSTDCNDNNPNINPNAIDICDGIDNNCNGIVDENATSTFYADTDGDGFGNISSRSIACTKPYGYVADSSDCNDNDPNINPNAIDICDGIDNNCNGIVDENAGSTFYADTDGDGFGNIGSSIIACTKPDGYVADSSDCNDNDPNIKPTAIDICDGIDNNCNGVVDENAGSTFYADTDGDGFGNIGSFIFACTKPDGYVADSSDCNDNNPNINPNAIDICDGIDNNCNGIVDENATSTFYVDTDGDGFGNISSSIIACTKPDGYVADSSDCNDNDANINPNAKDVCDGIDNNCNGLVDENPISTFYADADGDGFGNINSTIITCTKPNGYVADSSDCNDNDASINPNAIDICDGIDNNCNGLVDENPTSTFYADTDGDGFGNINSTIITCTKPNGYVTNSSDCNDNDAIINPNAKDVCDGIDNNCNGVVDENALTANINPFGNINICSGSSILLTANTGTAITYQWQKNGANISGATSSTLNVTKAGNYSVNESNTFSCNASSQQTKVTILSLPAATITALGSLNICSTGLVILQANSGAGLSYQWKKGTVNINGATAMQYTATSNGTYSVIVTNSNNCSKQSKGTKVTKTCFAAIANTTIGNSQIQGNIAKLSLFPNPTTGKVINAFYSDHIGKIRLTVYDITGKQVFTSTELAIAGNNRVMLNLGHLVSGMYYLELFNNQEKQRIKFTVER